MSAAATDILALQRLDGKVAMVTGAGAGIGRATSLALAAAGAHVAITDIDVAAAKAVAAELGHVDAHELDVADESRVGDVVQAITDEHGRIDILVNNAGVGARAPTVDVATENWDRALAVGPTGSFFCIRAAGPHMLRAGSGSVVNVASIMGLVGGTHYPNLAYHTAKGALINLTRALACEWAPRGVRVNAVAPTFVQTALIQPLLDEPGMTEKLLAKTPMGRLARPEEIAAAILFLAGDAASMITGHVLPVDGGWLAH
jgi:NAD(P)-dependent dehydrogenase (short-subunit alcohol dehydrogenase family)